MNADPYRKSMFTVRIERVEAGALAPNLSEMPSSGLIRSTSELASRCSTVGSERQVRRAAELDGDLGDPLGQALARPD